LGGKVAPAVGADHAFTGWVEAGRVGHRRKEYRSRARGRMTEVLRVWTNCPGGVFVIPNYGLSLSTTVSYGVGVNPRVTSFRVVRLVGVAIAGSGVLSDEAIEMTGSGWDTRTFFA
jgi:hypothetical protein